MNTSKITAHRSVAALTVALSVLTLLIATVPGCQSRGPGLKNPPRVAGPAPIFTGLKETADKWVTVAGVGDVNFGNGVTPYLSSRGIDYPWLDAGEILSGADLAFVNLECCISSSGSPAPGKEFTFRGPADSASSLRGAGVDVVSLANNHFKDFGTGAFLETLAHLEENGIGWCGVGKNEAEAYAPVVLEAHGRKVTFLAYNSIVPYGWPAAGENPGCATTYDRERIATRIRESKADYDYVVVSFHWGIELATSPSGDQRELAHLAVDSGADLVLGHHPHVVQGFELYRNRLIAYSLGNFVFCPPREISAKTVAVIALLGPDGLIQAKVVPMAIRSCRPVVLSGGAADSWMERVAGYCRDLGTSMTVTGGRGFINGGQGQDGEVLRRLKI